MAARVSAEVGPGDVLRVRGMGAMWPREPLDREAREKALQEDLDRQVKRNVQLMDQRSALEEQLAIQVKEGWTFKNRLKTALVVLAIVAAWAVLLTPLC